MSATATAAAAATRARLPRFEAPDPDLPRRLARRAGIGDLAERAFRGERLSFHGGLRPSRTPISSRPSCLAVIPFGG